MKGKDQEVNSIAMTLSKWKNNKHKQFQHSYSSIGIHLQIERQQLEGAHER